MKLALGFAGRDGDVRKIGGWDVRQVRLLGRGELDGLGSQRGVFLILSAKQCGLNGNTLRRFQTGEPHVFQVARELHRHRAKIR